MAFNLRSVSRLAAAVPLFSTLTSVVDARPQFCPRSDSVNGTTYDYVIVGGGLTGLVVANRLSELNSTVLVIEHGYIDNSSRTLIPYYANSLNTADMWDITSAPLTNLNNQTFSVYIGDVVGGGSVVNGMEYDRASAADYDAWESLGNEGWGWDGLLPYFKKCTTFTPPPTALAEEFNITYDSSYYGNGPLQASIATFQYEDLKTFWAAWRSEDVPLPEEGASGDAVGTFWTPSALDQKTATRSHARNAYYDPISSRPNLSLLTGQTVNEILFSSNLTAQGVQLVSRADNSTAKVFAKKEVILAAGAVHTPWLLQLSGVGPHAVLKAANIKTKKDFPAVGANFQDHPAIYMSFTLSNQSFPNSDSISDNSTYNATAWAQYVANKTGVYAAARGNSASFLSLPEIDDNYAEIVANLSAQGDREYLPSIYSNGALWKGFEAQRDILIEQFSASDAAVAEYPFNGGSGSATTALQKPLSRGTVTLNATAPQGAPIVQYNTLMNPVDKAIILAMVRYNRAFYNTTAMSVFSPVETLPGTAYQTDAEILNALVSEAILQPSFAHPSGSCAMMPQEIGGCVGADLLVYGTSKLSIVDASIIPMIPGAHLQATMYAVGEKAADVIKTRA